MPGDQVTLVIAWVTWVTFTDMGQQGPRRMEYRRINSGVWNENILTDAEASPHDAFSSKSHVINMFRIHFICRIIC